VLTFHDATFTKGGVRESQLLERGSSALAAMVADDTGWRLAFRAGWDAGSGNYAHDRNAAFDHSGAIDRVAFIDGWEARGAFDR
jgi:hypothetical protein